MIVRATKTPPERICPIYPELLPHLMRAKKMARAGADLVVNRYGPKEQRGRDDEENYQACWLGSVAEDDANLRATR